jgi:two-component system cell cycle response regulator
MGLNASAYRPIASTLIRGIFLWATVCTLLFTAGLSMIAYWHVKQEFNAELSKIAATNVPLLAINLWDIERAAVQQQIDNIAIRPQIGCVKLTTITGQQFFSGDQNLLLHSTLQRFDIAAPNGGKGGVGTLEICENKGAFYRDLAGLIGFAAIGFISLTLVICSVCLYILKRELAQPLLQIAKYLNILTPQSLAVPIVLKRHAGHRKDEIDLMVEGFQVLQAEVTGHIVNLDAMVAQRTQELQKALTSIKHFSQLDALTQCLNRGAFDAHLEQEVERAQRYARPFSLVFADIDYFKRINDTYGHVVGDQVLRTIAACLREGIRTDVDWIARYGGEEFVIVMPETDLAGAVVSTERLRLGIAQRPMTQEDPTLRVTASFGVAQYVPGEAVQTLIERADAQLYCAKQAGRNRTFPT